MIKANREELLKTISNSKKGKMVALLGLILSVVGYVYLDQHQTDAEKKLLILDKGILDEVVLE